MLRRLALAALLALVPALGHAQFATIGATPAVTDNGDRLATTAWVNNFFALGIPLANGKLFIGSVGGLATAQSMSGDCTIVASGVITCTQAAGNFQVIGNLTVGGSIIDGSGILATNIAAPATPAAGTTRIYVDSTTKALTFKNDAGTLGNAVVPSTCGANLFGTSVSAAGVFGCTQPSFSNLTGTLLAAQEPAHTGDVTNTAGSLALTLVTGNAGNLNSGTLLAARMPALTGDCTTSAGAVATTCTKINGVDQTTAWTTFSPTVTSQTGTLTSFTATGRYKQIGKTIMMQADVTLTNIGTGAAGLRISLPFTAAAFNYEGSSRDIVVSGKTGCALVLANGTTLDARAADGTTYIANTAQIIVGVTYEIP